MPSVPFFFPLAQHSLFLRKTEWVRLEERRRLRGFTLPYKICSTADYMIENWQEVLEPCPKFFGTIPTSLDLNEDVGGNYYLEGEAQVTTAVTNTIQPINLSAVRQAPQSNYILM